MITEIKSWYSPYHYKVVNSVIIGFASFTFMLEHIDTMKKEMHISVKCVILSKSQPSMCVSSSIYHKKE